MRLLLVGSGADMSTRDVEDGYRDALRALGHEIIEYRLSGRLGAAASWLHHAWTRAGKPAPRPTDADVIYQASVGALERALRFQPDWVLVISGMYFHPDAIIMLRRANQRLALLLTESPYDTEQELRIAPFADVVFTNERACVAEFRRVNPSTYYLAHAYNPARHFPSDEVDAGLPAHDVVFVGTGFIERIETLSGVDWTGIDLGLYGTWQLLGSRSRLRRYVRGGVVPNAVAAGLYRRAKVGLNLYRVSKGFGRHAPRVECAESLNPRALELAATGCFTISDWREEVSELFGDDVPTFRTPEELEALVRYYLSHSDERRERAARLPARVAGQTYAARAAQLVSILADASQREAA